MGNYFWDTQYDCIGWRSEPGKHVSKGIYYILCQMLWSRGGRVFLVKVEVINFERGGKRLKDELYIVSYYIKWVTITWTDSTKEMYNKSKKFTNVHLCFFLS